MAIPHPALHGKIPPFAAIAALFYSDPPMNSTLPPRLLHTVSSPFTPPAGWVLAICIGMTGCGQGNTPQAAPPPGGGMPPATVGVVTVHPGMVGLVTELPGRLEAARTAQVRARAAGILQKQLFVEGSTVRAGQALFQIDASPYQAALASAEASLARAEANLTQASAQADRLKPLFEAKAVSQQEWVAADAAHKQALADVAVGRAAVQTAKINLGYATITAPISGRIGRALVTEGALVGQGEATPMAVIQQIDPLYVNFTQSASEVMRLRRAQDSGQLRRTINQAANPAVSVRLVLEDDTEYDRAGKLLFSDLTVDATSGQITLRAEVPNPAAVLLPGLFVRVRLQQSQARDAITLPQQAVTRSPQGDSVMVVSADGLVSPRPVKVGSQQNGQWVIVGGLKAGEQVMVDGFQKLRGNAPVKAEPWQPKPSASADPAARPASTASTSGPSH